MWAGGHALALHDAADPPERAAVLAALASARQVEDAPPARPSGTPLALALPRSAWAFLLDLPGFELEPIRQREDGGGVAVPLGTNPRTGVNVSVFVERIPDARSAKDCRAAYFDRALASPLEKSEVRRSERDGIALGEYLVARAAGRDLRQRHLNAYLFHDGACVDVHLSKVLFEAKDRPLFDAVIATARFGPARP